MTINYTKHTDDQIAIAYREYAKTKRTTSIADFFAGWNAAMKRKALVQQRQMGKIYGPTKHQYPMPPTSQDSKEHPQP